MRQKLQDYGLVAVVFVAFAVVIWLFAEAYSPGTESPLTSLRHLRNVIIVQDQAVGSNVIISYVALTEPSYVIVQPEDAEPGQFLAVSRLLPEGEAHNFRVVVEGGLPSGFYYAILRRDDGDGTFDYVRDSIVRDARGAASITRFLVSDAPSR